MTAERLRAAAALIRERAEVWEYHRGPWRTMPGAAGHTVVRCDTEVPADEFGPGGSMDTLVVDCDTTTTADHIASWHPVVALAVAPLLVALADRADEIADSIGSERVAASVIESTLTGYVEAVTFASAYLGATA